MSADPPMTCAGIRCCVEKLASNWTLTTRQNAVIDVVSELPGDWRRNRARCFRLAARITELSDAHRPTWSVRVEGESYVHIECVSDADVPRACTVIREAVQL